MQKNNYRERLHKAIPGGAHTYSRDDDQFPSNAPEILLKGEGAYVYDHIGNEYLDYGMGLRSVNLGYANPEVLSAAVLELKKGNNLTRASITELKAAELLIDLIPSVEMVKFAKHGSTVTTAAIKLARAYTNRKYIAVPSEQPFFSFNDWFIGSTDLKRGTLTETASFTLKFNYGDIDSLKSLFKKYPNQIAGVILEPSTVLHPCLPSCKNLDSCYKCKNNDQNFLKKVRALTKQESALMILDEMITGFRWDLRGGQFFYNVEPDLCTFGKAMANGFAVSALCGKREIMSLGSIRNIGAERVFLTSTTHGAEMSSLGAFIKTVEILKRDDVIKKNWEYGTRLIVETNKLANQYGISNIITFEGLGCSPSYSFHNVENTTPLELRTLFLQEMIKQRILMPYISISYAHGETEFDKTMTGIEKTFDIMQKALKGNFHDFLDSKVVKPVFRKYN
ncbi:glutamate-1-semialdehyde 2,1-aminomutase [Flavobacteriaceae bacterium]|nr:glutamate-1-semialdehyde 2,1-aminomutase [Flavobacteriaceae bacterium]